MQAITDSSKSVYEGPGTMHTRIAGCKSDSQPIVISAINNDTVIIQLYPSRLYPQWI